MTFQGVPWQVLHDCRRDADALLHQHGVRLRHVFDTQVRLPHPFHPPSTRLPPAFHPPSTRLPHAFHPPSTRLPHAFHTPSTHLPHAFHTPSIAVRPLPRAYFTRFPSAHASDTQAAYAVLKRRPCAPTTSAAAEPQARLSSGVHASAADAGATSAAPARRPLLLLASGQRVFSKHAQHRTTHGAGTIAANLVRADAHHDAGEASVTARAASGRGEGAEHEAGEATADEVDHAIEMGCAFGAWREVRARDGTAPWPITTGYRWLPLITADHH